MWAVKVRRLRRNKRETEGRLFSTSTTREHIHNNLFPGSVAVASGIGLVVVQLVCSGFSWMPIDNPIRKQLPQKGRMIIPGVSSFAQPSTSSVRETGTDNLSVRPQPTMLLSSDDG